MKNSDRLVLTQEMRPLERALILRHRKGENASDEAINRYTELCNKLGMKVFWLRADFKSNMPIWAVN